MLMKISKQIELAANLAIILIASLLGIVIIKNHLLATPRSKMQRVSVRAINRGQRGRLIPPNNLLTPTFSFPRNGKH